MPEHRRGSASPHQVKSREEATPVFHPASRCLDATAQLLLIDNAGCPIRAGSRNPPCGLNLSAPPIPHLVSCSSRFARTRRGSPQPLVSRFQAISDSTAPTCTWTMGPHCSNSGGRWQLAGLGQRTLAQKKTRRRSNSCNTHLVTDVEAHDPRRGPVEDLASLRWPVPLPLHGHPLSRCSFASTQFLDCWSFFKLPVISS